MSADDRELRDVVDAAWVLGAVTPCLLTEDPGVGGGAAIDAAAQDVMDAGGVRISPGRERVILGRGLRSQLGQILMVADASSAPNWGAIDDATLVSQGRSSGGLWSILAAADGPAPTVRRWIGRAEPRARTVSSGWSRPLVGGQMDG
jgi:hypothetical protein